MIECKREFFVMEPITRKQYLLLSSDSVYYEMDQLSMTMVLEGEDVIIAPKQICDAFSQGNLFAKVLVFHELGHIYYGHNHTEHDNGAEREKAIDNNQLYRNEEDADQYAVSLLGKEPVIHALIKAGEMYKDNPKIVKEIALRIKAIACH